MSDLTATDGAKINHAAGTITYQALPCPLPAAWQAELKTVAGIGNDTNRLAAIVSVEQRARAMVGVQVTRPYIPPASQPRPVNKWKIGVRTEEV